MLERAFGMQIAQMGWQLAVQSKFLTCIQGDLSA